MTIFIKQQRSLCNMSSKSGRPLISPLRRETIKTACKRNFFNILTQGVMNNWQREKKD